MTADAVVLLYVGLGVLAFTGWAVWTHATKDLQPGADRTSRLVYYTGRAAIWGAVLVLAGSVFGVAARMVWSALGGAR